MRSTAGGIRDLGSVGDVVRKGSQGGDGGPLHDVSNRQDDHDRVCALSRGLGS